MQTPPFSPDIMPEQAVAMQRELATRVIDRDDFNISALRTIAGVDVSLAEEGRAAIVVLSFPELLPVETVTASVPITFPYVPGLLAFREMPLVLAALQKLSAPPDLIMIDGQGRAHPRRFGIACFVGVHTGIPAIGVAKSVLCGKHEPLGEEPGSAEPLVHRGETIGTALRSKKRTNPLIVSLGHRVALPTAVQLVQQCLRGYRLPEPTRQAHNAAGHGTLKANPMSEYSAIA
ncbi:MAG: deoxyribonuclease V [Fibrella sp.]|nr:deoxyribonuclease V [Armatimonadota bacterium]